MQKTAQSLLAFFITFLLAFTLFPLSAFASEDEAEIVVEEYGVEIGPTLATTNNPQKENSYRYENGVPISSEDGARTEEQNFLSTFSIVTNPNGYKVYDWFDKYSQGYYTGTNAFKGIDVSQHNGVINWAKVKSSGVNYAIIRCGYGNNAKYQDDTQWLNNVKGCIAQGIPFGVYIYSYAVSVNDANSEADHVLRCLSEAGLSPAKLGYPVYFDMEDKTTVGSDYAAMATAFCNKIKKAGYTPGIYANKSWFTGKLTASCFNNWTKWVAQWNVTEGLTYSPLSNFTSGNGMWQFSDYGKVPGIDGHAVDLDYTFMKPAYNIAYANYSYSGMMRNVTGGALVPNVTVKLDGKTLRNGTDYKIYYKKSGSTTSTTTAPTTAGTYEVIVVGAGDYNSSKSLGNMYVYAKPSFDTSFYCRIDSAANGSYVLDASGAAPKKGANVSIWTKNGGSNQLWKLEPDGNGYYVIRSVANSNYVLDASGASPKNGANISVWTSNGGLNQKWILVESDGSYIFRNAANNSLALDASGTSPKKGANVTAWTAKTSNNNNQKWNLTFMNDLSLAKVSATGMVRNTTGQQLKPVSVTVVANGKSLKEGTDFEIRYGGGTTKPSKAGNYTVSVVGKGSYKGSQVVGTMRLIDPPSLSTSTKYQLVSTANSNYVLDASGATPKLGSNVSIWTSNGGNNQKWYFMPDGNGFYTIKCAANQDYVLDASGSIPKQGSNISIWSGNSGLNQKWIIESAGNGTYVFRNAANPDFVLDASGKIPAKGANVSAWTSNGGNNQKWVIKP